jgi:hypothetical protein
MSASKFASITASLLARKGEARPWTGPGAEPQIFQDNHWRADPVFPAPLTLVADRPVCDDTASSKRFSLRMTPNDYVQLGILAARQGSTRQKFLQAVLRRILDGGALEFSCLGRAEAEPQHKW